MEQRLEQEQEQEPARRPTRTKSLPRQSRYPWVGNLSPQTVYAALCID